MLLDNAPILELAQNDFPGAALIGNRLRILVGDRKDGLQCPVMSFHLLNISKNNLSGVKCINNILTKNEV